MPFRITIGTGPFRVRIAWRWLVEINAGQVIDRPGDPVGGRDRVWVPDAVENRRIVRSIDCRPRSGHHHP